jgi:hypothetical protein
LNCPEGGLPACAIADRNGVYGRRRSSGLQPRLLAVQKNCDDDRRAIEAIGEVLLGSNRPFVITSGTAIAGNVDGKPSTEDDPTASWNPRAGSEATVKELTARGVDTSVVRLPQAHDTRRQGLIPYVHSVAREKRVSAYIGDGGNR